MREANKLEELVYHKDNRKGVHKSCSAVGNIKRSQCIKSDLWCVRVDSSQAYLTLNQGTKGSHMEQIPSIEVPLVGPKSSQVTGETGLDGVR